MFKIITDTNHLGNYCHLLWWFFQVWLTTIYKNLKYAFNRMSGRGLWHPKSTELLSHHKQFSHPSIPMHANSINMPRLHISSKYYKCTNSICKHIKSKACTSLYLWLWRRMQMSWNFGFHTKYLIMRKTSILIHHQSLLYRDQTSYLKLTKAHIN